jgi:hypothetical protein
MRDGGVLPLAGWRTSEMRRSVSEAFWRCLPIFAVAVVAALGGCDRPDRAPSVGDAKAGENTPDGRPVIDHLPTATNAVVATLSSVGFGLSPASGHAIAEIVSQGRCSFADLSTFRLSRFGNLAPRWREEKGWLPPTPGLPHADAA